MSLPPATTEEHAAEGERIAFGKVIAVGVLSLVIFAIGILWSTQIQRTAENEFAPQGEVAPPHPRAVYEVGMVNVAPFHGDTRAADKMALQRRRLQSYGWVNKEQGIIHVPIDQVFEQMVREAGK